MNRSEAMRRLRRQMAAALFSKKSGIPIKEILQKTIELDAKKARTRRDFLATTGKAVTAAAFATTLGPWRNVFAGGGSSSSNISVGIVGAGLAGLACGRELNKAGVTVSMYDANSRVGGRCWSLRDKFPGQVVERGGELIDNLHKTMLGYCHEFNLDIEDVNKLAEGDVFYYFKNRMYTEAEVVEQFRDFVDVMHTDLRLLSGEISANSFTSYDAEMDQISLAEYLDGNNADGVPAGELAREVIRACYTAEYGLETEDQSCLNFLHFIHADNRSKFRPWGVFSDERYHVVGGNDGIVSGLSSGLSSVTSLDMKLVKVAKTSGGRITLTFKQGASTVTKTHDHVVLAIPFSVLKDVTLDSSLGLSAEKSNTINSFSLGFNAKHMIGFDGRPWFEQGCNGASYSDLTDHQCTWETNVSNSSDTRGVLTDYSGGDRGYSLDPNNPQGEASKFLNSLDIILPGSKALASRSGRNYVQHLEHWPSNAFTKGSYTCYRPGDFTSIAGLEGTAVGNLHFAGEHTDSFYSWQGFMEGGCLSGLRAASEILRG